MSTCVCSLPGPKEEEHLVLLTPVETETLRSGLDAIGAVTLAPLVSIRRLRPGVEGIWRELSALPCRVVVSRRAHQPDRSGGNNGGGPAGDQRR